MLYNLRFISSFDEFPLPNQGDLSAHCFYHFSASNDLRLRCNNKLTFLWEFSVKQFKLGNLMKTPLFKIDFLNDQNTLVISPSHFWFSHV